MGDLPLPVWPGWHRMPTPFEIRWSYEAWEGAYGEPWQPHWKPWPWEPEPRAPQQMTGEEIFAAAVELMSRRQPPWPAPIMPPAVL